MIQWWHSIKLSRNLAIAIVGAIALTLALLAVMLWWRGEARAGHWFYTHTQTLQTDVAALNSQLSPAILPSAAGLSTYAGLINGLSGDCHALQNRIQTVPARFSPAFRDHASQTRQLCHDLLNVTGYTANLYTALQPFITADTSSSTGLSDLVASTIAAVKTVPGDIDDPARTEIITELTQAAQTPSAQLGAIVRAAQRDVWQRRIYFWNNTVQIGPLEQAISRQISHWR